MTKTQFTREDIINLLIKQAQGFYYTEEQFEYEKTQNKSFFNKNSTTNNSICTNFQTNDRVQSQITFFDDKLNLSNEETNKPDSTENLTLVKKKVATHYISPDMHAIKILLEIFTEKVGEQSSIENMTDEELLALKNKLIGELLNEPNQDKQNN